MVRASLNSDPLKPSPGPADDAGGADRSVERDAPFRIAADGTWFYFGSAIQRPEMVKLFATVLRREGDGYMLVTPHERHAVIVDDAPYVAVAVRVDGDGAARRVIVTTNVGREVALSPEHPLVMRGTGDQPRPYIVLEPGIEARIGRAVYYELAALAEPCDGHPDSPLGVRSGGGLFPLEPSGPA